jgi:hypothetical protein
MTATRPPRDDPADAGGHNKGALLLSDPEPQPAGPLADDPLARGVPSRRRSIATLFAAPRLSG